VIVLHFHLDLTDNPSIIAAKINSFLNLTGNLHFYHQFRTKANEFDIAPILSVKEQVSSFVEAIGSNKYKPGTRNSRYKENENLIRDIDKKQTKRLRKGTPTFETPTKRRHRKGTKMPNSIIPFLPYLNKECLSTFKIKKKDVPAALGHGRKMESYRLTTASVIVIKNSIIVVFCLAFVLLPEQTTVDAYSVLPPVAFGRQQRSRWVERKKACYKNSRQHRLQSSLSLPISLGTSLQASRSFDYVQNSTVTTPVPPELRHQEKDDIQLLRFMEEAILELEAFQISSYGDSADLNYANDNDGYTVINSDVHHAFSSDVDANTYRELSLPQISVETNTNTTAISIDRAIANDGNSVAHWDGIDKSDPLTDDRIDEEGIWRARWLLIAAAALYGTNFSVVKLLGDEMPVGISTSLRFGLAAAATFPWLVQGFIPRINLKTNGEDDLQKELETTDTNEESSRRLMAAMYGLEVGLWNSIGYVAQAVGLETTLASKSAFLCSMAVVIVPLLDRVAGKRLLLRQWVGAIMALVGVAFLELGDVNSLFSSSDGGGNGVISTGDVLSLVQPFTFGLGFWRMEQAMRRFPQEASRMTAAQLMAIFVSSVGYCLWTLGVFENFFDGNDIIIALGGIKSSLATVATSFPWKEWLLDPSILFSLFWTGCITTALTIYMETLALESLSAAETTLIFSTEPLWGTAFAVAVMGEQMGLNAAVGAGLILTACVYSNLGARGLQEMIGSTMKSFSANVKVGKQKEEGSKTNSSFLHRLQARWPWLLSGMSGSLASWNIASDAGTEMRELDDIVEELIEKFVDKL